MSSAYGQSGLKRYGSQPERKVRIGDKGAHALKGEVPKPLSNYAVYAHETHQCEKCHGYGTVNRLGDDLLGGDTCGECHGLGCVGDTGVVVRVEANTFETKRRVRNRELKAAIGAEEYKRVMRKEWVERSRLLAKKRSIYRGQ